MSDNYNINTTQGQANEALGLDPSNPAMTYVNFENSIVQNANQQKLHEQQVAAAALLAKQKQAAANVGINPELKDYFTVPEAVSYLKAAGVDQEQIDAFVQSMGDQQYVNKYAVDTILRKKDASAHLSVAGKYFKTDDNIKIPEGSKAEDLGLVADEEDKTVGHVPANGEYQVSVDSDGTPIRYISLGNSPADKPSISPAQAASKWAELGKRLHDEVKVGRGTALTQSLMRANRALSYLAMHPNLDRQGLMYIQQDLVGIFQGGVPTEEEMKNADYSTAVQKLNSIIGNYTGAFGALKWNAVTAGDKSYVRDQLQSTILDMRSGLLSTIEAGLKSHADEFQEIIQTNPKRYSDMLEHYEDVANAGLNKQAQDLVSAPEPVSDKSGAATPAPNKGLEDKKAALRSKLGI